MSFILEFGLWSNRSERDRGIKLRRRMIIKTDEKTTFHSSLTNRNNNNNETWTNRVLMKSHWHLHAKLYCRPHDCKSSSRFIFVSHSRQLNAELCTWRLRVSAGSQWFCSHMLSRAGKLFVVVVVRNHLSTLTTTSKIYQKDLKNTLGLYVHASPFPCFRLYSFFRSKGSL